MRELKLIPWLYKRLREAYLCVLHLMAMNIPFGRLKRFLYRVRGSEIGNKVTIASGVFLEELFPFPYLKRRRFWKFY